ncbi:MAG: DUF4199 domain-containing protein [Bacteroidales bacterium]|nr:DUF4199 domain-containing protein [Bacteroidales bacterium]
MENLSDNVVKQSGKQTTLFQNSLYYGLLTGVAYIVVTLLYYALEVDRTGWLNYLTFIILIIGIFIGTKAYRDKHSGGFLSYGQSVGSGVMISLAVGVLMSVFTYLFYEFFDPSELAKIVDVAEQNMADQGLSDEEIEQAMAISSKFMTPLVMSVTVIFGMAFWGTIFSLIISLFIKKENDSFDATYSES